jgi:septal ring factor EnvC (AmiA/AmiB activator)
MAARSLGRTLGNLLLALLNATLILAALCLWLAWGALSAAERVSGQIEAAAQAVTPLRAEIVSLTEEIAAARAELAAFRARNGEDRDALERRLAEVEAELARLTSAVAGLGVDPEALIDRAVTSAFDRLGQIVADALDRLRGAEAADG